MTLPKGFCATAKQVAEVPSALKKINLFNYIKNRNGAMYSASFLTR